MELWGESRGGRPSSAGGARPFTREVRSSSLRSFQVVDTAMPYSCRGVGSRRVPAKYELHARRDPVRWLALSPRRTAPSARAAAGPAPCPPAPVPGASPAPDLNPHLAATTLRGLLSRAWRYHHARDRRPPHGGLQTRDPIEALALFLRRKVRQEDVRDVRQGQANQRQASPGRTGPRPPLEPLHEIRHHRQKRGLLLRRPWRILAVVADVLRSCRCAPRSHRRPSGRRRAVTLGGLSGRWNPPPMMPTRPSACWDPERRLSAPRRSRAGTGLRHVLHVDP